MQSILNQFVTLWVVIDPIGTIPVFIAITAGTAATMRKKVALQAALVSAGVLLFFLVFGQMLINALDIGLNSFQVAGGIVLFLFALTMIFGEPRTESDRKAITDLTEEDPVKPNPAIFPLAVPSLASPGAMLAIVILTDNNRFSVTDQAVTAVIMLVVIAAAYVLMRLADPIIKLIGHAGSAIVSRVMGMILASVAANAVLKALLTIFATGEL
ncbi:MarC family protein [Pseudodonghicola xiamenensis]|uniref:MarC family protein n=1 Tax=Pseudodonghicola xiamenensis TaxID=337702 RepID=UPI0004872609